VFSDATSQVITGDCGWSSDDPAAAAMSASTATAVAQGTANIAASFSFAGASAAGSAPVAVSAATLTSLSIFPASALLAPSTTQAFSATGTFSDGTLQSVNGLANWTSSDPSVVSIKASGVATGQSAGTATITAAYPALGLTSNPADLLVEATQLQAIAMTPLAATVPATISTAFIATGAFADGSRQNLTAFVTWASSDGSRSTISNSSGQHGIATGMAPGTARLTAVFDGQVGSASLAVTDATLLSISVTPANPSIPLGQSQAFLATGRFSDGTTLNLSLSQPTWISSDLSVAVISPSGLATSAGRGTSMITVSVNGVRGASVLTVH
jgi:uncharacterized protein YjdB